jgi:tRNA nucleotidyltransferase (CCA-adding enzyme)
MTNNTQAKDRVEMFVVGGAIRDTLLGRPVKDVDWVVVGATPQGMFDAGFQQVGADFPVFLHHETGEEFALARTERKTGDGYHGFETDFDPSVTLEADLWRRDLTINAMAVTFKYWPEFRKTGNPDLVIDPFNGKQDLKDRELRHVSEAFADDPVRILRIARFAARYDNTFVFTVAPETMALMKQMVTDGEVDHLVAERVWAETEKALMEDAPWVFFMVLGECEALKRIMPFIEPWDFTSNHFMDAVLRNLNLEQRLMLLMVTTDHDSIDASLRDLKVPINLISSCLKFNKLVNLMDEHPFEQGFSNNHEVMFDVLNELNAWKCQDQLREMGVAVSMITSPSLAETFNVLMVGLMFANVASFSMLTDEQKTTLKGKEIGEAIGELRKEMLREMLV